MTGFGAATVEEDGEVIAVEIRAVNHRFLDVKPRLPRDLVVFEQLVLSRVRARLERGAVEVTLRRTGSAASEGRVALDLALARDYAARLTELGDALGLSGEPEIMDVARLEGVVVLKEPALDTDSLEGLVGRALDGALDELVAMREREGETLVADMTSRLETIAGFAEAIGVEAPAAVTAYKARLEARIQDLASSVEVEPARLATEVAILADKSDVAEELTRLASHVDQFEKLLAGVGAVGRKLDFLVQEMNREVNTIGSKSASSAISEQVVDLKAELERVREQVQNLE